MKKLVLGFAMIFFLTGTVAFTGLVGCGEDSCSSLAERCKRCKGEAEKKSCETVAESKVDCAKAMKKMDDTFRCGKSSCLALQERCKKCKNDSKNASERESTCKGDVPSDLDNISEYEDEACRKMIATLDQKTWCEKDSK